MKINIDSEEANPSNTQTTPANLGANPFNTQTNTSNEEVNPSNMKTNLATHEANPDTMDRSQPTEETNPSQGILQGTELVKLDGWGFADSGFLYENNVINFVGERYKIGRLELPYFTAWCTDVLGVNYSQPPMPRRPLKAAAAKLPARLLTELKGVPYSVDTTVRVFHSHGQSLEDIYNVRYGELGRVPDVVIYPQTQDDVELVIQLAMDLDFAIIPFGGGTTVTGAVSCPEEPRTLASLDMSRMKRVLDVDQRNCTATVQAGITGKELEQELGRLGFTMGHEPDSYEFSTLGGWISTRASGMKKNVYGNIEDIMLSFVLVTPRGVVKKYFEAPRVSIGPDINNFVLGSEGSFGVITQATFKICTVPQAKKHGSLLFPDFESGFNFVEQVSKHGYKPASIRLIDNEQFLFGQTLKAKETFRERLVSSAKKFYLAGILRFDLKKICVVTLLFEGAQEEVEQKSKKLMSIATVHGGLDTGGENGERGYMLTFVIAYIRDIGLDYRVVAESFETSVSWDKTLSLCANVKNRLGLECRARNIRHFLVSCRVTQTYHSGAVVYFYFAFNYTNVTEDPVGLYTELEHIARQEILSNGGSLSHHHGVGKVRQRFLPQTMTEPALDSFNALKNYFDPKNIFGSGNLYRKSKL